MEIAIRNNEYLMVENDGEIDINALKLLGASTKDGTKIGYFGSGIKYALASAFRLGIKIRVFCGEKEVKITTRKTKLRQQDFQVLCINNEKTSIVTTLGRDWKPWYIVREFYCNALDETGYSHAFYNEDEIKGVTGKTRVFIELAEQITDVVTNTGKYFCGSRTPLQQWLFEFKAAIFSPLSEDLLVYRRGIQVYSSSSQTHVLYDYDFHNLPINEAREAGFASILDAIKTLWLLHATPEMVLKLANSTSNTWERSLHWSNYHDTPMSNGWLALEDTTIIPSERSGYHVEKLDKPHYLLPLSLCTTLIEHFPQLKIVGVSKESVSIVKELQTTEQQNKLIRKAQKFIKRHPDYKDVYNYPVIVSVLDDDILGMAYSGKIYISSVVFERGLRAVIDVLLEEYVHNKYGVYDCSRPMQNVLLNGIINALRKNNIENEQGVNW